MVLPIMKDEEEEEEEEDVALMQAIAESTNKI